MSNCIGNSATSSKQGVTSNHPNKWMLFNRWEYNLHSNVLSEKTLLYRVSELVKHSMNVARLDCRNVIWEGGVAWQRGGGQSHLGARCLMEIGKWHPSVSGTESAHVWLPYPLPSSNGLSRGWWFISKYELVCSWWLVASTERPAPDFIVQKWHMRHKSLALHLGRYLPQL